MKYLFLMGASGSGKTTLAKNLDKFDSKNYKRIVQITTREKRDGEIDGDDYEYISQEQFDSMKNELFESVESQFLPNRYGAKKELLDETKWNVVVVSIEGFLSAMKHTTAFDRCLLINILVDDDLDVQREGRNPMEEEKVSLGVLNQFLVENLLKINNKYCFYKEISLKNLKQIREHPAKFIPYFNSLIEGTISESLKEQLRNCESYDELITIFMNNSSSISNDISLLDLLEIQSQKFRKSVKEVCDDSLAILRNLNKGEE